MIQLLTFYMSAFASYLTVLFCTPGAEYSLFRKKKSLAKKDCYTRHQEQKFVSIKRRSTVSFRSNKHCG